MTAQLPSRERLKEIAIAYGSGHHTKVNVKDDEVLQIVEALLAAHEQEPVYQVMLLDGSPEQNEWVEVSETDFHTPVKNPDEWRRRILYTHPAPVPAVPDEMTIRDACKFVQDMRIFDDVTVIVMRTWNACRAAMLNGGKS